MNIEEAIFHALNGEAIIFAGAGFSTGAINQKDEEIRMVSKLCELLCSQIGMEFDNDLPYVSEKYIAKYGASGLIEILKQMYSSKTIGEHHKDILGLNWRRIYTTNYDDVIEKASSMVGVARTPVTLSTKPSSHASLNSLVIHINGFIQNLTFETLNKEFKLSHSSYLSDDIKDSDWIRFFSLDIKNAKAVFFVGYSLNSDLDIQRILFENDELKEKCFFITHESISEKNKDIMKKFGQIEYIGVEGLALNIKSLSEGYVIPKYKTTFSCFKHFVTQSYKIEDIKDKDIVDLFVKGMINENHIKNSSEANPYYVTRNKIQKIIADLSSESCRLAILHSDLGNGKTFAVHTIIYELSKNSNVFLFTRSTDSLSSELEYIAQFKGTKYIVIENYNLYLGEIAQNLKHFYTPEVKFIFTARSLINDVLIFKLLESFRLKYENVKLYDFNELTDGEVGQLVSILEKYNLWGNLAAKSKSEKIRTLKKKFNNNFQGILLGLMNSKNIGERFRVIVDLLSENKVIEEIILTSFVNSILSLDLDQDEILYLYDQKSINALMQYDANIKEIISVEKNRINVRSSVVAKYILMNFDLSSKVIDVLVQIARNADKMQEFNNKHNQIMRAVTTYSNFRLLMKEKEDKLSEYVTQYYEKIKNLKFNRTNPSFWLQYAIARLESEDYDSAKIYFENAYSYASNIKGFDTYQIDTHFSRFLLEKHIYNGDSESSYEVFKQAHQLIINNKNRAENFHYPLRHVKRYYDFYKKFYSCFTNAQRSLFIVGLTQINEKIDLYFNEIKRLERKEHRDVVVAKDNINRILSEIRKGVSDPLKGKQA